MEGNAMNLIWGLILGAIAGFIASKLMSEKSGTIKNILLGIGGGFVGGLVFKVFGFTASGLIGSLIVSTNGTSRIGRPHRKRCQPRHHGGALQRIR